MSHLAEHINKWTEYRDARRGTYEFRCATRYKGVADKLRELGLESHHTVMDVGAGSCQFGRYLREGGFQGLYIPIDAVLDGTNLEDWTEPCTPGLRGHSADFVVSIEVAEHLTRPLAFLQNYSRGALNEDA